MYVVKLGWRRGRRNQTFYSVFLVDKFLSLHNLKICQVRWKLNGFCWIFTYTIWETRRCKREGKKFMYTRRINNRAKWIGRREEISSRSDTRDLDDLYLHSKLKVVWFSQRFILQFYNFQNISSLLATGNFLREGEAILKFSPVKTLNFSEFKKRLRYMIYLFSFPSRRFVLVLLLLAA